jgi:hypothetical protein
MQADATIGVGRCLPLSTEVPLLPIADALRTLLEYDGGALFEQAVQRCAPYVAASLSRVLPEVGVLAKISDPDDEWSRQRLFEAIGAILVELGRERRAALLIDDVHWADTATLDLLEHMLVRHPGVPIVGTWRLNDPDTSPAPRAWHNRVEGSNAARTLDLTALTRDETADLLRHVTGGEVEKGNVDRIHLRTGGHPLFTELLAGTGSGDPLPRALSDLLDRRIDALNSDAEVIVHALGVADRGLPDSVVMAATRLNGDRLARGLRDLSSRLLLAGETPADQVQLRHPLVAEAARQRLTGVETREMHRRIALALSELDGAAPGEVAAHWQGAGDHRSELMWRIRAAREAEARFGGEQAALHWVRVLELWPEAESVAESLPASRAEAYFGAMDGWDLAGMSLRGLELAVRAKDECIAWSTEDRAEVLRKLAAYKTSEGDVEGEYLTAEAIRLYRECPQTPAVVDRFAVALIHQSFTFSFRGRTAEATTSLREAEALLVAHHSNSSRLREVQAGLAWMDAVQGHLDRALQGLADLGARSPAEPAPVRDVMVAMYHSDVLLMAGKGADEVAAAAEPGLAAAREYGLDAQESNSVLANVVIALIRAGRIAHAARLIDELTNADPVLDRWILHLQRVVLDLTRGRLDAARDRSERLRAMESISTAFMAPDLALLHTWAAEPDRALELITSTLGNPQHIEMTGEVGAMLVLAARAAADLAAQGVSDPTALTTRLTSLRSTAHQDPFGPGAMPADRHAAPQWEAELARLNATESIEHWHRAANSWGQLTRPHDASYCRWRAAQIALRMGQGTLADRLLKQAAADAREHVPLSDAIAATRRHALDAPRTFRA